MTNLHLFLFLLGSLVPALKEPSGDRVLWTPGTALTWDHFRAAPDPSSRFAALTRIDMSIGQGPLQRPGAIELIVSTELATDGSWVKPESRTLLILGHEQGHFDIAEYHARRLRKTLLEMAPLKVATLNEDVDREFERIFREKDQMQHQYDQETDHSIRLEEQLKWEKKIASLLDSLAGYSDRSIILSLR